MHFGLLPRANRGIFAINELPDLAGRFRWASSTSCRKATSRSKAIPFGSTSTWPWFYREPEDYTARGKIITPLKDRIGSEITTHYPLTVELGTTITKQEAWVERNGARSVASPISWPN